MLRTQYASAHDGKYPTFHRWSHIHLNAASGFDMDHGKNMPLFYSYAVDGRTYAVCTQAENGPIYSRLSDEEVRQMQPQPLGVQ